MTKGYNSYRGRRSKGKIFLIVLLLLILAAACLYMVAQRFVVYRDDGTRYLDLPFLHHEEKNEPPAGDQDGGQSGPGMNLVVDEQGETDTDEPGVLPDRRLIGLEGLPADNAALDQLLTAAGANGAVYTIRDNTGKVFYDSAVSQEKAADRSISPEMVSVLCDRDDVYAAARFNCFHDSYYASVHRAEAGICRPDGAIWADELNYYWLDPAKEDARRYVVSLAQECARMGFDELMLEDLCYPAGGDQSRINYAGNTMGKAEALKQFLQELRAALTQDGSDVKLSLVLDPALLQTGSDEITGQDLAALLPLVDAVYVQTEDPAAARTQLAQYADDPPPLFPIVTEAAGQDVWYLPGR